MSFSLKLKNKIITLLFTTIFLLSFFIATQAILAADYGLNATLNVDSNLKSTLEKNADLPTTAGTIIGAALSFVGIIFLILMIYGGFQWMTAGGNEEEIKKAKELIIAAVIGLIIVLSAYAITAYIGLKLQQPTAQ